MAIKDVLLSLASYPDRTPDASIDRTLAIAAELGCRTTALTFEAEFDFVRSSGAFTRMVVDLREMAREESIKSGTNAKALLARFQEAAKRFGVDHDTVLARSSAFTLPDALIEHAKLHDMTVIPLQDSYGVEQWHAETTIFGSGRPVLVLPGPVGFKPGPLLNSVVVAWDFGAPAARALGEAMPLLEKAAKVHVVTVRGEKHIASKHAHREMAKHLQAHGVEAEFRDIDAAGRSAAAAIDSFLTGVDASLLVMGAYGHSRLREFVLGGATRSMLDAPPVPVFLSH
ncbi:MAG: universal stress protein [Proteobacteria bacterium]|nr:universal stress protein [Pseudomonadota bacterium]